MFIKVQVTHTGYPNEQLKLMMVSKKRNIGAEN